MCQCAGMTVCADIAFSSCSTLVYSLTHTADVCSTRKQLPLFINSHVQNIARQTSSVVCLLIHLAHAQVLGIIGWSIVTKVRTGSGLPAGPSGLLGAVEGFSYLSLLGGEAPAAA